MRGAWVFWLLATTMPANADNVPHKEGQYGGVSPGDPPGDLRPATEKSARGKRPPPKGTLTWIGFEAKNGGAEVFFQSVAPFTLEQHVEGGALVVHLGLTKLGPNTWRQVDTRFFDNPLSNIVARAVGAQRATKTRSARAAGIEARIAFKSAKDAREATVRTATEADGRYYAYLAFPEGADSSTVPSTATPGDPEDAPPPRPPAKAKAPAAGPGKDAAPAQPTGPVKQETDDEAPDATR